MAKKPHNYLSKREQQIMDFIYLKGKATAADVYEEIKDFPSYSAARVMMHLLEDKKLLRHERQGPRYVYYPTVAAEKARRQELKHVVNTFFGGSLKEAMADLIELTPDDMSEDDWREINRIIDEARKQGR
jgi:predicted transcriptional regulator